MAAINKILKYQLVGKLLKLDGEGKTTQDIADLLSEELKSRGIDDSISQPTVHRHLQTIREERAAQGCQMVQDYNEITVPGDIEILEEIKAYFLMIFRNQRKEDSSGEIKPAGYDYKMRSHAAMNLHQIVYTKWQKLGNLPKPGEDKDGEPCINESPVSSGSKVHSILGRFKTGS